MNNTIDFKLVCALFLASTWLLATKPPYQVRIDNPLRGIGYVNNVSINKLMITSTRNWQLMNQTDPIVIVEVYVLQSTPLAGVGKNHYAIFGANL